MTGIRIKLKITKGATLTNAEEESNSFSVIDLARSTAYPEILNLNPLLIYQQNAIPVGGRINYFKQNWQRITKDHVILNTIQVISLDWITYPIQKKISKLPNLNLKKKLILHKEISDLEQKTVVIRVAPLQDKFISNILLHRRRTAVSTHLSI